MLGLCWYCVNWSVRRAANHVQDVRSHKRPVAAETACQECRRQVVVAVQGLPRRGQLHGRQTTTGRSRREDKTAHPRTGRLAGRWFVGLACPGIALAYRVSPLLPPSRVLLPCPSQYLAY